MIIRIINHFIDYLRLKRYAHDYKQEDWISHIQEVWTIFCDRTTTKLDVQFNTLKVQVVLNKLTVLSNMGFNLQRLICSSQAETNSIGFPTNNIFTSGKRRVAIAFDKPRAQSNFVICPTPRLKPRQDRVSGYFWIRNFFFPDRASVHTHPANSAANPGYFLIRSPQIHFVWTGKFLNPQRKRCGL